MFLELLQSLGAFTGGLGALIAATTQLLGFLKKESKPDEASCADAADSRMVPARLHARLRLAA